MRCHPRFREFLLKRLARRSEAEQRELYRAHARLLIGQNHDEEAVEEYLEAGCPDGRARHHRARCWSGSSNAPTSPWPSGG